MRIGSIISAKTDNVHVKIIFKINRAETYTAVIVGLIQDVRGLEYFVANDSHPKLNMLDILEYVVSSEKG